MCTTPTLCRSCQSACLILSSFSSTSLRRFLSCWMRYSFGRVLWLRNPARRCATICHGQRWCIVSNTQSDVTINSSLKWKGTECDKTLSLGRSGNWSAAGSRSNDITTQLGSTPATAYYGRKLAFLWQFTKVLSTQNQSQSLVCSHSLLPVPWLHVIKARQSTFLVIPVSRIVGAKKEMEQVPDLSSTGGQRNTMLTSKWGTYNQSILKRKAWIGEKWAMEHCVTTTICIIT